LIKGDGLSEDNEQPAACRVWRISGALNPIAAVELSAPLFFLIHSPATLDPVLSFIVWTVFNRLSIQKEGIVMRQVETGGLYGSLELLILKILRTRGPMHGLAIARHIHHTSDGTLNVDMGSLYPALHRLQGRGLLDWEWLTSEKQRRAKYYDLTPKGRKHLETELRRWIGNTQAILKVLELATGDLQ
jgi:transcriptional regulator